MDFGVLVDACLVQLWCNSCEAFLQLQCKCWKIMHFVVFLVCKIMTMIGVAKELHCSCIGVASKSLSSCIKVASKGPSNVLSNCDARKKCFTEVASKLHQSCIVIFGATLVQIWCNFDATLMQFDASLMQVWCNFDAAFFLSTYGMFEKYGHFAVGAIWHVQSIICSIY